MHDIDYCNCFWVVADLMYRLPGLGGFDISEIARLEQLSEEEVKAISDAAESCIRIKYRKKLLSSEYES